MGAEDRFCRRCGTDLVQSASHSCRVCGSSLAEDDRFCADCGTAIEILRAPVQTAGQGRKPALGWWPASIGGSIGLILLVVFSAALAYGLSDGEPMAAIIVGGAVLLLFLFWRKAFVAWEIIGAPDRAAGFPADPEITPVPASPVGTWEGLSKGARLLLLFLFVVFLGLIRKLAPVLADWLR